MLEVRAVLQRQQFRLDVDISFSEKVNALFGPSGSGKSTLLSIITGTLTPQLGRVQLNHRCLLDTQTGQHVPLHRREIGLVFQDGRLFPHLSIEANLRYGERMRGHAPSAYESIVELLELKSLLGHVPYQLSGGEKQRVALGRALLSQPKLLLLDEPLASLDQRLKAQILPYLKRIVTEVEIPMLYVSHDMREIEQLTSTVTYLEQGKQVTNV